MKIEIDINNEFVDDIVIEKLTEQLRYYEDYIIRVIETGEGVNYISDDVVVELSELMKCRDAIKRTLSLFVQQN